MQRTIRTIILLLFTLYVQSGPVQWAAYWLCADNVAAAYCVNPGVPACHGRCHMASLTRSEQKKDGPVVEISIDKILPFLIVSTAPPPVAVASVRYPLSDGRSSSPGFPPGIDHPPLSRC